MDLQKSKDRRRKRGRPKQYDPEEAIGNALQVFWTRGYAGTSLAGLSRAMRMSRTSLNAAFGDKRAIYALTLTGFREEMLEIVLKFAHSEEPTGDALVELFRRATQVYAGIAGKPTGCPIVCTAPAEAGVDPEIRRLFHTFLLDFDQALSLVLLSHLSVAAPLRPLSDEEASNRGRMAAAVLQSLALRSRAGESSATLERFARFASELIITPLQSTLLT